MQQEIAVRMDNFVPQNFGHLKLATVDLCSSRRSLDGSDMAEAAADSLKDLLTRSGVSRSRKFLIARRSLGGAYEVDKPVEMRETVAVTFVFGISQGLVLGN